MSPFIRTFPTVHLGFILVAFILIGNVLLADVSPTHFRIDRWTQVGKATEIDEPAMQRIAERVGPGHFFVTQIGIENGSVSGVEKVRLLAFYSVTSLGHSPLPIDQALLLPDGGAGRLESGSPGQLLAAFFSSPSFARAEDSQVSNVVSGILSAGFFGDEGHWLNIGDALTDGPVIVRDAGGLAWSRAYLRKDGGVEELAVTFSPSVTGEATLSRRELYPAGFSPVESGHKILFEEWTIAGGPKWHPAQRYKMMATLAALGNPAKQFQLASALLQEPGDDARTEGLKWLHAAAAQGYRDAIDLLRQSAEELMRPDRDRDKIRLSRCCPVPGR